MGMTLLKTHKSRTCIVWFVRPKLIASKHIFHSRQREKKTINFEKLTFHWMRHGKPIIFAKCKIRCTKRFSAERNSCIKCKCKANALKTEWVMFEMAGTSSVFMVNAVKKLQFIHVHWHCWTVNVSAAWKSITEHTYSKRFWTHFQANPLAGNAWVSAEAQAHEPPFNVIYLRPTHVQPLVTIIERYSRSE